MSKYSLSDEGRSYLDIYLTSFEQTSLLPVEFKVDTGADLTTISKKELVLLGYSYEWIEEHTIEDLSCTLSRAGGKPQPAYYVQIAVSSIEGHTLVNWPFYIRKERQADFSNLLGLNVLTYFNFRFDYRRWKFHIKPIATPKKLFPMLPNQSICEVEENCNDEIL